MITRLLLSAIAVTFIYSEYALAEVHLSKKPAIKPTVTHNKPTVPKIVQPKWKVFTSPDGSFSVLMPGKPQREIQIQKTYMGEINLEIFKVQPAQQEVAYVVTYNNFPDSYAQMHTPQELLNQAQAAALKTTRSTLLSQRNIRSSNNHLGREIEYVDGRGKVTRNRMYIAQDRLYQVIAIVSKKQHQHLAKTITGYLNSFHIVFKT